MYEMRRAREWKPIKSVLICEEARARGAAAAILNRFGELQLARGVMFLLGILWRGTEKSTRPRQM